MGWDGEWRPYVSVAQRQRNAQREMNRLRKKGVIIEPVAIDGRKIAKTFWGEAWCDHLESFSDFENRLPRGRTYARNGSVCHLTIGRGKIEAKVAGSELYDLTIRIQKLPAKKWRSIKGRCAGQIGSLLELLQGKLSDHVMEAVTDRSQGLFPLPGEISFDCDCPDWAVMCKHVAAVLYGVGARLDEKPELLFELRGVNHDDLIDADAEKAVSSATRGGKSRRLAAGSLSDVFGIDVDAGEPNELQDAVRKTGTRRGRKAKPAVKKKAARKKAVKKKAGVKKTTKQTKSTKSSARAKKKAVKKKAAKKKVVKKTGVKKKAVKKMVAKKTTAKKKANKKSRTAK
jgi:uncharacterized Zn finger protein